MNAKSLSRRSAIELVGTEQPATPALLIEAFKIFEESMAIVRKPGGHHKFSHSMQQHESLWLTFAQIPS
jgi:hypothetical protein